MRLRLLIIVVVVSPARAGQALALGLIINSRPYHLPRRPTPLCRALCDPHIPSIRTAASSRAGAAGADLSNIRLVLPLPPRPPKSPINPEPPGQTSTLVCAPSTTTCHPGLSPSAPLPSALLCRRALVERLPALDIYRRWLVSTAAPRIASSRVRLARSPPPSKARQSKCKPPRRQTTPTDPSRPRGTETHGHARRVHAPAAPRPARCWLLPPLSSSLDWHGTYASAPVASM